jgi:F-type H+-transporting ATPase subunit delta
MQNTKLSNRYSKALLELALEQSALENVNADMKSIVSVYEANRDLQLLLKSPIVKEDKKMAILNEIFKSFNKLSTNFINLIVKNRREASLYNIAKEFNALFAEYKNIQQIVITSAITLDDNLRKRIVELTSNTTKSEVELIEKTNPNLLGGFVLRIGDNQFDTSIATKIRKVKRDLIS